MPRLVPAIATEEVVYVPEELEPGTGRTPRQVKDMAKNAPKPIEIDAKDRAYARQIARHHSVYPKIMYAAAKYRRVYDPELGEDIVFIDGDIKSPGYHQYNLIQRGKTIQVFDRHPFKTIQVDTEAEEKAAIKKGFVAHPDQLHYEWEEKASA